MEDMDLSKRLLGESITFTYTKDTTIFGMFVPYTLLLLLIAKKKKKRTDYINCGKL